MSSRSWLSNMCLTLALLASPQAASADVKQGVDAWAQGDFDEAVEQWRDLALKGDADAQFNMGQAYKMGRGVKSDLSMALEWYDKAAAQGHLQAADSYGHLLHYMGRVGESLPYLDKSADRGDPRAQYLLGTELFNGIHIEKDWVRAYALMTRASSAGMTPASRSLAQMDQYVPFEQRQQATALASEMELHADRARTTRLTGAPKSIKPPALPSNILTAAQNPVKVADVKPKQTRFNYQPDQIKGTWRIQLGAFGDEANARKLWNALETKYVELAALQPYLTATGKVTRLQAGPFALRKGADAMCSKIKSNGQACISVPT